MTEATGRQRKLFLNGNELREMTTTYIEQIAPPDLDIHQIEVEFEDPVIIVDRARFERLLAFACKFRDASIPEDYDVWEVFSRLTEYDLAPIP